MIIGIPREIKIEEFRVALTPAGARELVQDGHEVWAETGAGEGSGFTDADYESAGAGIRSREEVFASAELIVKVKEPLAEEYGFLREDMALFTFLHLAPNPELTSALQKSGVTALAYETLVKDGRLPLLAPMSEVAGRMAPLAGAHYMQKFMGGTGVLPAGAVGTPPARALIIGAGVVGTNAARVARGMGMDTTVLNINDGNLIKIDSLFQGSIKTLALNRHNLEGELAQADLVIGAIYARGARTPVFVTREMLPLMKKGAILLDVAVDQGGCFETTRPTTHDEPVFTLDGILHYGVANMPGAYPRTSTLALTNVTLPYVRLLAGLGIKRALEENESLRTALNVRGGEITLEEIKNRE